MLKVELEPESRFSVTSLGFPWWRTQIKGTTKSSGLHRPRRTVRKSQSRGVLRAGWGRCRTDYWEEQTQRQASNPTNGRKATGVEDGMCSLYHGAGVAMEVTASHGGQFGYSTVSQEASGRDWTCEPGGSQCQLQFKTKLKASGAARHSAFRASFDPINSWYPCDPASSSVGQGGVRCENL